VGEASAVTQKNKKALAGAWPSQGFGGIGLLAGNNTPCVPVSGGVSLYTITSAAISHSVSVPTAAKVIAAAFTPVELDEGYQ